MTTIQVRTDGNLKKSAQKVLKDMGLDMSTAVNLYLHQIVTTQSIPFPIRAKSKLSLSQELKMLAEHEEALKYGKRYDSAEELINDILNEEDDENEEDGQIQSC